MTQSGTKQSAIGSTTDLMNQLAALLAAAQPLIALGKITVSAIVALFKKARPQMTNEELNAMLGPTLAQAYAEEQALEQERKDAEAEQKHQA